MSALQEALSTLLTDELRRKGVTRTQLADRAGIDKMHLSRMLTGKVAGSLVAWDRLFDALGIHAMELTKVDK